MSPSGRAVAAISLCAAALVVVLAFSTDVRYVVDNRTGRPLPGVFFDEGPNGRTAERALPTGETVFSGVGPLGDDLVDFMVGGGEPPCAIGAFGYSFGILGGGDGYFSIRIESPPAPPISISRGYWPGVFLERDPTAVIYDDVRCLSRLFQPSESPTPQSSPAQ